MVFVAILSDDGKVIEEARLDGVQVPPTMLLVSSTGVASGTCKSTEEALQIHGQLLRATAATAELSVAIAAVSAFEGGKKNGKRKRRNAL
jgi:hypothetical protein